MNELLNAVVPFLPELGGGISGSGGGAAGGGGSGWPFLGPWGLNEEGNTNPQNPWGIRPDRAGPSTGQDNDESDPLFSILDDRLYEVKNNARHLAKRAAKRAAEFGLDIPGSLSEQEEEIHRILVNKIEDEISSDDWYSQVKTWESQFAENDLAFWDLIASDCAEFYKYDFLTYSII